MRFLVALIFAAQFSYMVRAQDIFTLGSSSGETGETISLPLYFQDRSNTLIDTGFDFQGNIVGFGGFEIRLQVDTSLMQSFHFRLAGVLDGHSALEIQNEQNGEIYWAVAAGQDFPLNLDASSPGDLIGFLDIVPSAAAEGQTITFVNGNTSFVSASESETVSNGELQVNLGNLVVGGGQGSPPVVVFFRADPVNVAAGESTTLEWDVIGADTVSINQGVGVVSDSGSRTVTPSSSTVYLLTAENEFGSTSAQVSVGVAQPATITSFSVSPRQIEVGGEVRVTWETLNAIRVTLRGEEVALNGTTSFTLQQTSDIELIAEGEVGDPARRAVTVTVLADAPKLVVDQEQIVITEPLETGSVSLSVENAGGTTWSISELPEWLQATPGSGVLNSGSTTIRFTPNYQTIAPGTSRSFDVEFAASGFISATTQVTMVRPFDTTDRHFTFFSGVPSGSDSYAEIEWLNLGDSAAEAALYWFDQSGTLVHTDQASASGTYAGGRFRQDFVLSEPGWALLEMRSEGTPSKGGGTMLIRAVDGKELVALSGRSDLENSLFVPHIAADPSFFTRAFVTNLSEIDRSLVFQTRGRPDTAVQNVSSGGVGAFDFRDILGDQISAQGWGRLAFEETPGFLIGNEIFGRTEDTGLRQSVGVGLNAVSATELYFPHIAADTLTFWTGIVVINVGNTLQDVTFQAYNAQGAPVGEPLVETLQPSQKRVFLVDRNTQPFGEGAAWLKASSQNPLVGYELFGTYDDRFAGFESVSTLSRKLLVSHLEETVTEGGWSGIALINPNDFSVDLDYVLIGADGSEKERIPGTLGALGKFVGIVTQIFTLSVEDGDKVIVESSGEIAGFELFGFGAETMGAILTDPL